MAELNENFHYSLPNIALAIYAKLGGRPWCFEPQKKKELVIGISAYFSYALDKRYLGSAFSFSNDGKFGGFECFENKDLSQLAGSIKLAVKDFINKNDSIDRLIIHFYKRLSYKELQKFQKALSELDQKIPVVVVTINKSFSEDIVGFDTSEEHLMPVSGHYLQLSNFQYLLYNNQLSHNSQNTPNPREGFPFPLKINAVRYNPGESIEQALSAEEIIPVMEQLCRFSLLYWKSVSRQWMPVTLRYPEMLAQIAPHFKYRDWGKLGSDSLWFL